MSDECRGRQWDGECGELRRALAALDVYDKAADKFIAKVESGRARSVETYADLRAARDLSRAVTRG